MVVSWWVFVSPSEGDISLPVVIEQKDNVLMCGLLTERYKMSVLS